MRPIQPFSITAPGFAGLNTQDAPVDMDGRFSLVANNCIIDKFGRVGSRKGWLQSNTTNATLGTSTIGAIGELVTTTGALTIITAGNNNLFRLSSGTLVTLTYGGGGTTPTITADNWQMCVLTSVLLLFQSGHDPLIYDPAVSTTQYKRISEVAGYTGTVPLGNCAISAFGRIWTANTTVDKNTVTWSDTLTYSKWTAGSSGSLNLHGVWPQGGDNIVALGQHNGNLIIFGTKQILIYSGPSTPSTMALVDSVSNIGCSGRNTVANTPEDLLFLSPSGVRALSRTIQEKSAPLNTISRNVNDNIQSYTNLETNSSNIKGVYSPIDSFYLLTFVGSQITYCFDLRELLPDGAARTTNWSLAPNAYHYSVSNILYIGMGSGLGVYTGSRDNAVSYRMSYYSSWLDFGDPVRTSILKKIIMTLFGASGQSVIYKWGFDYMSGADSQTETLAAASNSSEYGIGQYGINEYSESSLVQSLGMNTTGSGKVVQVGIEVQVNGYPISVQRIDILTKEGRY